MKNQITLQTKSGEIEANIITVERGLMVATFTLNGKTYSGDVNTRKGIIKVDENTAAKIKETPKKLTEMYDACFEIKFEAPFLEVNHDGERMVKKGIKTNLFTGEVCDIEKTLWAK